MIALVLAMMWSRRGQAVTLALLALFGVAAAVAAPAYLRAADRAVAAGQVATALPAERSLEVSLPQPDIRNQDPGSPATVSLSEAGPELTQLPGFAYIYADDYATVGIEPDPHIRTRLVYRQKVCEHLTIVAGRCLAGESDVVLGEQTAKRLKIVVGQSVSLSHATHISGMDPQYVADGKPKTFVVAGLYTVPDGADVYWGSHEYFGADVSNYPAFIGAASLTGMDKGAQDLSLDGYALPGALAVDRLPAIRTGLVELQAAVTRLNAGVELDTGLTALLGRIDDGRAAAHRIVPVLAVALVILACLTIYLAVSYGTEGRRPELALVALRGARFGQRWFLATGENVLAILAGAIAGAVLGQLLVDAFAAWRFPGVGAATGISSLRWAPVAAAAAILTAVVAERRQLTRPVSELLRRVAVAPSPAVAIAGEIVVVALAVVAVVQLRLTKGSLTGVGGIAAALVMLAAALVAARLLLPWATAAARRALGRGRLGPSLAGFQLSRRPGAIRLFALLTAAVAVAAYAAGAIDTSSRVRGVQSEVGTGAARVLRVSGSGRSTLSAVEAADHSGRYAMAVVRITSDPQRPPVLAVDSTRLAAVASWPSGAPAAKTVAGLLRPAAPSPVTLQGKTLAFDVTAADFTPDKELSVTATVFSASEAAYEEVPLGVMQAGRHTYTYEADYCAAGCELDLLSIEGPDGAVDVSGKLTVNSIRPVPGVADGLLSTPGRWRAGAGGSVSVTPTGLLINVSSLNNLPAGMTVQPVDTPYPLPAAVAGSKTGPAVAGLDTGDLAISHVAKLPSVPGLGDNAVLVDLTYASRLATGTTQTTGEVWLAPDAPPSVLQHLIAGGLVITSDVSAAAVRAQLDQQGPALAMWFYAIVACLATALAAGALVLSAGVDRARRVEDLSALRAQGLSRAAVRTATLWTYPVLVGVAVVAGVLIAWLGWWLTGWALPLAGLHPPPLPLPGGPAPWAPVVAGAAILAVLTGVAFVTGRRTLARIP